MVASLIEGDIVDKDHDDHVIPVAGFGGRLAEVKVRPTGTAVWKLPIDLGSKLSRVILLHFPGSQLIPLRTRRNFPDGRKVLKVLKHKIVCRHGTPERVQLHK